jgi:2-methylisocitrate lyase-like PEP mutase family enzyme
MDVPQYDVFAGHSLKEALWIEAVGDLETSVERMKAIASEQPGAYFVFCVRTHAVVASVDTTQTPGKTQTVPA